MAPLGQSGASFEAGLYVVLPVAVVILPVVTLWCAFCKGSSKSENETLGKDDEEHQQDHRLKSKNEIPEKESLKREKESLVKDDEELQQNHNHLKRENKKLVKEKDALQKQNDRLKSEKETLVKESLKIENETLVKGKEALQKLNETLKQEKEMVEAEKEDLQKNYGILKKEKERLVKEKDELQKNYETLKQEKEKVEADFEELGRKTKIYKEEVEADFEELRRKTNTCGYALDREWKPITEVHVNVTLDPDTASPSLTVSEDSSRVRFTGERSAEWPSVLGREGFTSGSHYWEVEVGEKGFWVLGVSTHTHEKSIPEKPGEGYWLVRLFRGKTCTAVSQGIRSGDQILKLEKICKVWGVYLDHEGGRLSFCNALTRFHIHTFEGSFPGPVYPIFSPGSHDKGPLIIQRVQHTAANIN